jgi:EAL domain-containing protein (putative c-di-GMP-specific phosphodiesterase class I)/AmiR/NasT family two-component response regulator
MTSSDRMRPDAGPHSSADDGEAARGLMVLVAEDHEFQRSMLVEMIENLGARGVHEASDGRSALETVRELAQPFDVIVTDIDMPDMDGMAFIRNLAQAHVGASLIITSGLSRALLDSVETMCHAYGVRLLGTIEKPASPERLAELFRLHRPVVSRPERAKATVSEFALEEVLQGLHDEEFEPYFQPKVHLASSRISGAEALVRWRHPRLGIVLPYAFIGLLEAHERIGELTWTMLAKSAACCRAWREAGLDLNVSVNLSVSLLNDASIADAITWQVRNQGLDPRHMVLEVTETSAMSEIGVVIENLARLRMKGFGLSIDDYGTGYSSMQQLTRIPFTELKIDRSFVSHAVQQESCRLILESSLDMARRLRIGSVAEGAETQADWDLLRAVGCDFAQGYFIARPMPAEHFPDWVRDWA